MASYFGRMKETFGTSQRDRYLFSGREEIDRQRDALNNLISSETGLTFDKTSPFYYQIRSKFMISNKKEVKALNEQISRGIKSQQRSRLGNQTGGVRNGVARNPFNMNMMKGPMNAAPKKPNSPAPVQARYIGERGGRVVSRELMIQ